MIIKYKFRLVVSENNLCTFDANRNISCRGSVCHDKPYLIVACCFEFSYTCISAVILL